MPDTTLACSSVPVTVISRAREIEGCIMVAVYVVIMIFPLSLRD